VDLSHLTRHAGGPQDLVTLAPDHPGFHDQEYRNRRNEIAQLSFSFRTGSPVPVVAYIPPEHRVWAEVWESLNEGHARWACRESQALQEVLPLDRRRIPQLEEVNERLMGVSGFRMEPVAGLIQSRTFLRYLGKRVFLSTQYMRHHSRPLYTPEPDVVHELIGHAATLIHPGIAELNRLMGLASDVADDEEMRRIENVYWYTLEFGLVLEGDKPKAFGAGLLSSGGELKRIGTGQVSFLDWDIHRISQTAYDPTQFQKSLFVAPNFTRILTDVSAWIRAGGWRRG